MKTLDIRKPKIFRQGDLWICAWHMSQFVLLGPKGRGDTIELAYRNWREQVETKSIIGHVGPRGSAQ